ncbi:MAG: HAMP domain-containing protein [Saprospiraceae bacterium]|nr:HAMP domain-containing protein [Saprospiraceae bacterium]
MNIHTKLTLRFSLITASILVLFSLAVYLFSANFRREEFYQRLESRALTTATLLVTVDEVDKNLLRIIDDNSVPALPDEQVLAYDSSNHLDYGNTDHPRRDYPPALLDRIRVAKKLYFDNGDYEELGMVYTARGQSYVLIASAFDRYGKSKLYNLRTVILVGLPMGIAIIVLAGRIFAKQVLAPLAKINDSVTNITAGNLDQRLNEGNQTDEIARLAMNFNLMLERLERAFEVQQSFVRDASHELRTPLAAMRSQLQVELGKVRSLQEYQAVLNSQLDDVESLSELTNGLLLLARSSMERQRLDFQSLRVDEVLFNAQEELARLKPDYNFQFDYGNMPENEADLTLLGNERLLSIAFINLMDNACKYSPDKTVHISLSVNNGSLEISFKDNGPGIPADKIERIFDPFYRVEHVKGKVKGHGIGLSLCKKIVELHDSRIIVQSTLGKGCVFKLLFAAQHIG